MSKVELVTNCIFVICYMSVSNIMLETYIVCKSDPIHLGVACWIRCVMQHCFSLVSSVLRCQLTAVLGDSFVLFPYLCAHCNSGTSHPTCSPHPPSLYIKLNLRTTSGSAEVGYICLTTQRGDGEVGKGLQTIQFYVKVIDDKRKH